MSCQYLLEKTLRNKTILPKFDRDKIELNFGGCKMQYIPKEFDGHILKYRITLIVKDYNNNYIREADYLINDFWEVIKLVDKKYYDKYFEYYTRDRVNKLIENYYYSYNLLEFIYSYEKNGEKFVEIADEGILSSKDNDIKFTFKDGMKTIDINDYNFDSIYDSIQLKEQRYTVHKMTQIILNNSPIRKGSALFYKEIKVFRSQHGSEDYLKAIDNNRNTICYIKDKTIINHFDCILNSLEDSTIKLMEEEVDKKFKELGW